MITVIASLAVIFVVLAINEYLWRKKILKGEAARKFMHITIGVFGAFWPFFMSWQQIQIIGVIAIGAILTMRFTGLFSSVYAIERKSWGDLIGPATIVLLAFLEPSKWVFAAAVLHTALADGLAALIGSTYGKRNHYKIFGNKKSVVGTLTFWAVSLIILAVLFIRDPTVVGSFGLLTVFWLPVFGALLENISPYGSDNFFVPMAVYLAFQHL